MSPTYTKSYLDITSQLDLLKSRGLDVANDDFAKDCLHRHGYYRLSAYWYPFREKVGETRTDHFLPGSRFEDAMGLYLFDKKLKFLLLDAIECIEISVRVEIALLLGRYDKFAIYNPQFFSESFTTEAKESEPTRYEEWLNKFDAIVKRSATEFVKHHEIRYGDRELLPIWIAIELWDFGLLSYFYGGMKDKDRDTIASAFFIPTRKMMANWLQCFNYVRNSIAHHNRFWNLNLNIILSLPKENVLPEFTVFHRGKITTMQEQPGSRIYSVCCALSYLSKVIDPETTWPQRLVELTQQFPSMPHASINSMGFPDDWREHSFWKE